MMLLPQVRYANICTISELYQIYRVLASDEGKDGALSRAIAKSAWLSRKRHRSHGPTQRVDCYSTLISDFRPDSSRISERPPLHQREHCRAARTVLWGIALSFGSSCSVNTTSALSNLTGARKFPAASDPRIAAEVQASVREICSATARS